jgi:hypothetical protein
MTIPETLRVEIEAAACEAVHDAWMGAKFSQGVTSRKSETGEELMVPYSDLSDAAKALDAASVQATLDAALPILEAYYEPSMKRLEFAETLLDGGHIGINGIPWREAWERMQHLTDPPTDDYKKARGIAPAPPGSPSPEEAIRRIRGGA